MSKRLYLAAAVLVGVAVLALLWPGSKPRPVPVLPNPNGYDDFLQAASLAVSHRHLRFGEATDEELQELLLDNEAALLLVRRGCTRPSRVTVNYQLSAAAYTAQHMPVLAQFKKIALAFRAEGELAERKGNTNAAARAYLDGLRFGQELCRGGLIIDRMVGTACEGIVLEQLSSLVPDLDGQTALDLAQSLREMIAAREPIQATWDTERRWAMQVGSLRERITSRIAHIVQRKSLETVRQKTESKINEMQAREQDLLQQLLERARAAGQGDARPAPHAQ